MSIDEFIAWQKSRLDQFASAVKTSEITLDKEMGEWFEELYWFNAHDNLKK